MFSAQKSIDYFDLLDDAFTHVQNEFPHEALELRRRRIRSGSRSIVEPAKLRSQLYADVVVLAKRGYVEEAQIRAVRRNKGIKNVASDILLLSSLIRHKWSQISTRCAITEIDLNRAEILGDQLIQFLGARDRVPLLITDAAIERQQVFTIFARAYDQVRKAVYYLRWEQGDAEKLAPSFHRGRKPIRKKTPQLEQPNVIDPFNN